MDWRVENPTSLRTQRKLFYRPKKTNHSHTIWALNSARWKVDCHIWSTQYLWTPIINKTKAKGLTCNERSASKILVVVITPTEILHQLESLEVWGSPSTFFKWEKAFCQWANFHGHSDLTLVSGIFVKAMLGDNPFPTIMCTVAVTQDNCTLQTETWINLKSKSYSRHDQILQ